MKPINKLQKTPVYITLCTAVIVSAEILLCGLERIMYVKQMIFFQKVNFSYIYHEEMMFKNLLSS